MCLVITVYRPFVLDKDVPCFAIYFMLKMDKNQLFNDHKETSFHYEYLWKSCCGTTKRKQDAPSSTIETGLHARSVL